MVRGTASTIYLSGVWDGGVGVGLGCLCIWVRLVLLLVSKFKCMPSSSYLCIVFFV